MMNQRVTERPSNCEDIKISLTSAETFVPFFSSAAWFVTSVSCSAGTLLSEDIKKRNKTNAWVKHNFVNSKKNALRLVNFDDNFVDNSGFVG